MDGSKLILAGGSGFLGHALARHFGKRGWEVVVLSRRIGREIAGARQLLWDGENLGDWTTELEGAAAVVNLAGRSVNCRYTRDNRKDIMDSRVKPTRVLGEAIAGCQNPPRVWLNASSATIYRHTTGAQWDETATDFTPMPEARDAFSIAVIKEWERAFDEAVVVGTRKVSLRSAMVLGHGDNSVFPMLRRLARWGLGGRMGSGRQFVSWMHEEDFCRAVEWLIEHHEVDGPVNLASPHPLTNAEMMKLFRECSGTPFGLPASEWMLEIGAFFLRTETELVLKSRRVIPGKLLKGAFAFSFPTMRVAIDNLCGQPTNEHSPS